MNHKRSKIGNKAASKRAKEIANQNKAHFSRIEKASGNKYGSREYNLKSELSHRGRSFGRNRE